MITFDFQGSKCVMEFEHEPKYRNTFVSLSRISDTERDEKGRPLLVKFATAVTFCNPKDNYDRFLGAKYAVHNLCKLFEPEDRKVIWKAFYDRDYRGHIQRKLDSLIRELTRPVALHVLESYKKRRAEDQRIEADYAQTMQQLGA